MNSEKTEFMPFKQDRAIFTLNDKPLKLENQLTYIGSNILSTEKNDSKCRLLLTGYRSFRNLIYLKKQSRDSSKLEPCQYYCIDSTKTLGEKNNLKTT